MRLFFSIMVLVLSISCMPYYAQAAIFGNNVDSNANVSVNNNVNVNNNLLGLENSTHINNLSSNSRRDERRRLREESKLIFKSLSKNEKKCVREYKELLSRPGSVRLVDRGPSIFMPGDGKSRVVISLTSNGLRNDIVNNEVECQFDLKNRLVTKYPSIKSYGDSDDDVVVKGFYKLSTVEKVLKKEK